MFYENDHSFLEVGLFYLNFRFEIIRWTPLELRDCVKNAPWKLLVQTKRYKAKFNSASFPLLIVYELKFIIPFLCASILHIQNLNLKIYLN